MGEAAEQEKQGAVPALLLAALLTLLSACGEDDRIGERPLRIATYNLHLSRGAPGKLIAELRAGSEQIDALVEVIASADPDVLVMQELDHDPDGVALHLFREHLARAGLHYADSLAAPVNTGVATGLDLVGSGKTRGPENAQGWGLFEGQFGMAILSRLPIDREAMRSFRTLLWAQMPGALFPQDAYPPEAAGVLRLSSKSHWDVPLRWGDSALHLLVSHPTPPVFDGPEDRNGRRNHDEILFWSHYLDDAAWIRDDDGRSGGLPAGTSAVVAGDLNSDPEFGDSRRDGIRALLSHVRLRDPLPRRRGDGPRPQATADWPGKDGAGPGKLRVDYLLPTRDLELVASGIVWPQPGETLRDSTERASDHHLVWIALRRD